MSQLKYSQRTIALQPGKVLARLQLPNVVRVLKPIDAVFILLPLCAFILWSISLKFVDVGRMNDLGLISVLPPSITIALIMITISFCLALQRPQLRVAILLLHLVLLVFMLYNIENLVEQEPHIAVLYRHAGYTEYIMRTGSVDPYLDAYFNWPGFFVLGALITRVAGYHDILSFAGWAQLFFNLIYLGPLYLIFTSATTNKRLVWLGLWFFSLTNWVEQDYFAPQGLGFFVYLVIIAMLLKWFKVPPAAQPRRRWSFWQHLDHFSLPMQRLYEWLTAADTLYTPTRPWQRVALLVVLVAIFAFVVFSHPLTPFFVLVSVTALVIFRRCRPRWLPILMALMIAAWIIFMAQPFLAGHISMVTGSIGQVNSVVASNLTNRVVEGDPQHIFIARVRVIMTFAVWGLALAGAVYRLLRGHRDLTYILLAVAPFSLFVVQNYGGEMILRIYLFALPMMVFFAAALFYTASANGRSPWLTIAVAGISIVLLSGFLFTRYGNERTNYMTRAEVDGVRYLYSIAPPHSLFIAGWDGTPWQFQDYEKYNLVSLASTLPDAVINRDVNRIVQFIESEEDPAVYLIFTRSQEATAEAFSGSPPGTLDRLENALLRSGKFKLVYSNPDAQIFIYLH